MSSKPKLIQFDWSGTISDDTKPVYLAFNRTAEHLGLAPIKNKKVWLDLTAQTFEGYFSKLLNHDITPREIWKIYSKHFEDVSKEGVKPIIYEEVIEVLEDLKKKNLKMVVVSKHPKKSILREAKEYGIDKYFLDIIGSISDKTARMSSLPRYFGCSRTQTIYIGDMISDIKEAKNAKIPIIALTRGYHPREILSSAKPNYIWDNLHPAKTEF